MLRIARRSIRPDGHLVFTAFLDEHTEGGHSLIDYLERVYREQARLAGDELPSIEEARAQRERVPFLDVDPTRPLTWAMYMRDYAMELIEGAGWRVDDVREPTALRQHLFTCSPT
jgi:hypothetical protein